MSLYKKVLLLMDCTEVDKVILEHVLKLSKIHRSTVYLFHVIHAHTLDQERFMVKKTEECFKSAESKFLENGVKISHSYKIGEPEDEVLKMVNSGDWDLICLATHGHTGIKDFLKGSISDVIKHKTDKPILMIKERLK